MQTTLLNTYPPELLATILKALREQLKENDQPNAVEDCRHGTRNLLNTIKSWMMEDFATMSMEGICQKISRWLPDVQRLHGYTSQGVCEIVPMYRWKQEAVRFDLGDADISVDPAHKKCRSRLCAREYKTEWQGKISRNLLASQLCSAMPPLESVKVFVSIMMSVGWSSKCNPFQVDTIRPQQSVFPKNSPETEMCVRLPAEGRQKHGEGKVGRLIKNMHGILDASHI